MVAEDTMIGCLDVAARHTRGSLVTVHEISYVPHDPQSAEGERPVAEVAHGHVEVRGWEW